MILASAKKGGCSRSSARERVYSRGWIDSRFADRLAVTHNKWPRTHSKRIIGPRTAALLDLILLFAPRIVCCLCLYRYLLYAASEENFNGSPRLVYASPRALIRLIRILISTMALRERQFVLEEDFYRGWCVLFRGWWRMLSSYRCALMNYSLWR